MPFLYLYVLWCLHKERKADDTDLDVYVRI